MGFISWLLGRDKGPEEFSLDSVIRKIEIGLHSTRRYWFDQTLEMLERANRDLPLPRISRRVLGGHADLGATAFQFLNAVSFIEQHHYVAEAKMAPFVDALYVSMCRGKTAEVANYMKRYEEVDTGTMLIRFTNDVAEYMVGDQPAPSLGLLLLPLVGMLLDLTQMTIAEKFGDKNTIQSIMDRKANKGQVLN